MTESKHTNKNDDKEQELKCNQCEFVCEKEITLNKHTNTKHGTSLETQICFSECLICEEKFVTKCKLQKHKDDHIEEIKSLVIKKITKGHELLECNLCSFESGHEDSIREHMIDHVNYTKKYQKEYLQVSVIKVC